MALIAVTSAKGSPGVTTTALSIALGWSTSTLLVDADPAGGTINTSYLGGRVPADQGLIRLAVAAAGGELATTAADQLIPLTPAPARSGRRPAARFMLPGVNDPAQAGTVARQWPALRVFLAAGHAAEGPLDVIVDCGRLAVEHRPDVVLRHADLVLLVVRGTLSSVHLADWALRHLRADGAHVALVVVDGGEVYRAAEIGKSLDTPVALRMPWSSREADTLAAGEHHGRMRLLTAVRHAEPAIRGQLRAAVTANA